MLRHCTKIRVLQHSFTEQAYAAQPATASLGCCSTSTLKSSRIPGKHMALLYMPLYVTVLLDKWMCKGLKWIVCTSLPEPDTAKHSASP